MAAKALTGLEDHPQGTAGANSIINSNWDTLDERFYQTPFLIRPGKINAKTATTHNITNVYGVSIIPTRLFIFADKLTAVTLEPTIRLGTSTDAEEYLASIQLALVANPIIKRFDLKDLAIPLINGANLELEITTAATGTTYDFIPWIEVMLFPSS